MIITSSVRSVMIISLTSIIFLKIFVIIEELIVSICELCIDFITNIIRLNYISFTLYNLEKLC